MDPNAILSFETDILAAVMSANVEFPSLPNVDLRLEAAKVAITLDVLRPTCWQVLNFALDAARALQGSAEEIHHEINGTYVGLDDDGGSLELYFGDDHVAGFVTDGPAIVEITTNQHALLRHRTAVDRRTLPRAA